MTDGFRCGECGELRNEAERTSLTKTTGASVCGSCEVDVLLARLDAEPKSGTHKFLTEQNAFDFYDRAPMARLSAEIDDNDRRTVRFEP